MLLQLLRKFSIQRLLHLRAAALLEDLQEHEGVAVLEAETGVFADDLVGLVLRDYLIAVVGGGVEMGFENSLC